MDDHEHNENSQQQSVHGLDDSRLHEAIKIYMRDGWSKDSKEKIGRCIMEDAGTVLESLDYIKETSPGYWERETGLQELERLIYDNRDVFQEYKHFSKDEVISIYMKDMMGYLLLGIFVESSTARDKFLFSEDVFVNKMDENQRKGTFSRMEELYPNCYQIFSGILSDKIRADELFRGDAAIIADEIQDHYLPDEEVCERDTERSKRSIPRKLPAVMILVLSLCLVVLAFKHFGLIDRLKNDRYDKWLTKSELTKVKKLEEEYHKLTGVEIRYFQRMDSDPEMRVEHDGSYLFLVYTSMEEDVATGRHMMYSDILNDEQLLDFGSRFLDASDGLADYERCEKFFEMAYLEVTR